MADNPTNSSLQVAQHLSYSWSITPANSSLQIPDHCTTAAVFTAGFPALYLWFLQIRGIKALQSLFLSSPLCICHNLIALIAALIRASAFCTVIYYSDTLYIKHFVIHIANNNCSINTYILYKLKKTVFHNFFYQTKNIWQYWKWPKMLLFTF